MQLVNSERHGELLESGSPWRLQSDPPEGNRDHRGDRDVRSGHAPDELHFFEHGLSLLGRGWHRDIGQPGHFQRAGREPPAERNAARQRLVQLDGNLRNGQRRDAAAGFSAIVDRSHRQNGLTVVGDSRHRRPSGGAGEELRHQLLVDRAVSTKPSTLSCLRTRQRSPACRSPSAPFRRRGTRRRLERGHEIRTSSRLGPCRFLRQQRRSPDQQPEQQRQHDFFLHTNLQG